MKVRGCIALLLGLAALTFMLLLKDCGGKRRLALAVAQRQTDAQRRQDEAVRVAESARMEHAREIEAQRVQAAQQRERRKQRGRELIEAVTRNCETGTVKPLLEQGVDFDEEDYNGRTALMLAARYGCLDIIKMLVTYNVTINHKNHWDMTALDWAERAERGNPSEIQALLIESGAKNGRNRIAESTKLFSKIVNVNRDRTPLEALNATGRKIIQTKADVLEKMPLGNGKETEVIFFKLNKMVTDDDLEKEYGLRGLKPADPYSLAAVNEADPTLADGTYYNGTHWKNFDGKWCYAKFSYWFGERSIVSVNYNISAWDVGWYFAGVRK